MIFSEDTTRGLYCEMDTLSHRTNCGCRWCNMFGYSITATVSGSPPFVIPKKKRWDMEARLQSPLWYCRMINKAVEPKSVLSMEKRHIKTLKPRRRYCKGVRYALCNTRVL